MEFIASIVESSNFIIEVVLLINFGSGFSKNFSLKLGVLKAHVVDKMTLHFFFTHSSHCENFRIFSFGSGKHGLGVGGGVHDAGSVHSIGLDEVRI